MYQYSAEQKAEEQNTVTDTNQNSQPEPEVKLENTGIEIQGGGGGSLTICADKCGDNICQSTVPECKAGSPNCICVETKNDCPQDCK